jgi:hypothetical protein
MRVLSNVRIVCLTLATAGRLIPSGAKEGFEMSFILALRNLYFDLTVWLFIWLNSKVKIA